MAVFQVDFYSECLQKDAAMNVILPNPGDLGKRKLKVLTLLHGKEARYTKWMNRVPMELYARELRLAVIMPDGEDSFYSDLYYGNQYGRFMTEELLPEARRLFPCLSGERKDNFIAGSSMGGYGAVKTALARPETSSENGRICFSWRGCNPGNRQRFVLES